MGEDFGRIMTWPFDDYFFPEEEESSGGGGTAVDTSTAEASVATEEKKAKAVRSALYKTAGGSAGAELLSGDVKKRDTLLGN